MPSHVFTSENTSNKRHTKKMPPYVCTSENTSNKRHTKKMPLNVYI